MNADHPHFEDLSAHHDGEAPEWAEHVARCETCQGRLAKLDALTHTVARESPPRLAAEDGDDAVTRAVAAAGPQAGTSFGLEAGAGRRRWGLAAGTAAVIVISVGLGALVASMGPHRQMTRDALSVPGTVPSPGDRATAGANAGAVVVVGDLGEIGDRAALVARVQTDLRALGQVRPDAAAPSASPAPVAGATGSSAPSSTVGAKRPCEVEARAGPGDHGAVVYQATAEEAGAPAVVLAFGSAEGSGSITVEMRARSDCRLLLQGAIL